MELITADEIADRLKLSKRQVAEREDALIQRRTGGMDKLME